MQNSQSRLKRLEESLSKNITTNIVAAAALIFSVLSYQQSKKALDLQTENILIVKADYAVTDRVIFKASSCNTARIVTANARFLITNNGYRAFSLAKVDQENFIYPNMYAKEINTVKLSNGNKTELPIKIEPGESTSVLVPINFNLSELTCRRIQSGQPYNSSIEAIAISEEEYYFELGRPYVKFGNESPYKEFTDNMRERLGNKIEYSIIGERASRFVDIAWLDF